MQAGSNLAVMPGPDLFDDEGIPYTPEELEALELQERDDALFEMGFFDLD